MTTSPTIVVLAAGLSTPSSTRLLADRLSAASVEEAARAGVDAQVRTVELREYARDITDALLSHIPSPRLAELIDAIRDADAVIAVTPIFNTAPSGILTSLLAVIAPEAWRGKPVLLGATAGSVRHSLALEYAIRPIFVYLKAQLVPTAVFAASSDFGASAEDSDEQPLAARAQRAGAELAALLTSASAARAREDARTADEATPAEAAPAAGLDPEFADFTPMDSLLHHR